MTNRILDTQRAANGNRILDLMVPGGSPTPDPRYARPSADISAGAWLPSSGSDLYAMIDEVAPDSADYMYTDSPSVCEIALGPVVDPGTSSGQAVRYQLWDDTAGAMEVRLLQGATVIATWAHATTPTTPQVFERFLTVLECDSITDYTDLRLEVEAL